MKYLSLDVDSLTRDFRVRVMNAECFGGYVALLFEAAIADGRLPVDDEQLAALSKLGKKWESHKATILGMGTIQGETLEFSPVTDAVANWEAKRTKNSRNATARWAGSQYRSKSGNGKTGASQVDEPLDDLDENDPERKQRYLELGSDATALGTDSGGTPALSSNGSRVKGKEEDGSPVSGDRTNYSVEFELFWSEYRRLGGSTEMPKAKSYQSFKSAKRRASVEEIMSGLERYRLWLSDEDRKARAEGKPRSPREFVPMPTTWLNQSRWDSERKGERKKTVVPEPVCGVDYTFADTYEPGDTVARTGRVKIIDGKPSTEKFSLAEWYRMKGFPEEAKIYEAETR